mgnify:CR=1 FL=1
MIFKIKMEQKISQVVGKIKKDKNVIAIMLFGSYARNKEYARDIDICVFLDSKDNKKMFKKRLNYLKGVSDKFDIQIFQQLPLYVRISVLRDGRILYLKDKKRLYNLAYETLKSYTFFEKYYLDYIGQVGK